MCAFKVNASEKEDRSGEYIPLPAGKFNCTIVEVETKRSESEKNPGKPMLYFTMAIQDGPYAERTMGVNACCWDGALYTIIGILKAIDEYDNCKESDGGLSIPDAPEFYVGRDLVVRRGLNKKKKEENPEDDPESWIEVRGFAKYTRQGANGSKPSSSASLLP